MPWEHCGSQVPDDAKCPKCGVTKETWSVDWNTTREFQVSRRPVARFSLVDGAGKPVKGEPFAARLPDGSPLPNGTLDEFGFAKVPLEKAGGCQVSFPQRERDGQAVEALEGSAKRVAGGDGASAGWFEVGTETKARFALGASREKLLADDVALMRRTFEACVARMNASGERFAHPIPLVGGILGNNIYKYLNEDSVLSAPIGPLLDRLYDSSRYRNIKECYGQAETVLADLKTVLGQLKLRWVFGMASHPGHYWACAQLESGGTFVHMDAWKHAFWVSPVLDDKLLHEVSFQRQPM